MIVLTISTLYWEEDRLSVVNVIGMVVCVGGIALHVVFKALRAQGNWMERHWNFSKENHILFSLSPSLPLSFLPFFYPSLLLSLQLKHLRRLGRGRHLVKMQSSCFPPPATHARTASLTMTVTLVETVLMCTNQKICNSFFSCNQYLWSLSPLPLCPKLALLASYILVFFTSIVILLYIKWPWSSFLVQTHV